MAMTKKDGTSDIQVVPEYLFGNPVTLQMARMNRFNDLLDKRVSQWLEAGLFDVHIKWGLENIDSTLLDTELEPDWAPMHLELLTVVFGFFGAGILISILIFMFELRKLK